MCYYSISDITTPVPTGEHLLYFIWTDDRTYGTCMAIMTSLVYFTHTFEGTNWSASFTCYQNVDPMIPLEHGTEKKTRCSAY